jgi:glyoxylase-like metal-dependent hydrolase (beta-lactamase superfamily II)
VIELAPGVHRLGHGAGGRVSAFLIDDGGELSLVDTLFESDARLVLEAIRALGRNVTDVKRIALTHAHRSHLGGLAALKRASGATVYSHAWEADIVSGDRRAQPVTILPKQSLKLLKFQLGLFFNRPRHAPCPVDETLDDDDAFGPLQVLHAPGHSPGHLAFHWPERGLLIAGDAIATWPSFCAGWTAFNLNRTQHAASVRRMAALDAHIVGVGHGEPITEDAADRVHSLAIQEPAPNGRVRRTVPSTRDHG